MQCFLNHLESKVNNLRHQKGEVHIAATVSFIRIYGKITKSGTCIEKSHCAQIMSILVLFSIENATYILIIVHTSTDFPQTASVNKI